ncbi:hypothetical protein [Sphingomonas oleivorans]|uniref:hypothetical protein n=1 Tax=Sphingomonas oleivorans TaxID=1735121 RepID=UPI0013FDCC70|nr:hypothetical protein [Sphingomonas oleivorans]
MPDFDGIWQQAAMARAKWRCLIENRAASQSPEMDEILCSGAIFANFRANET